jgi:hypothetical protein
MIFTGGGRLHVSALRAKGIVAHKAVEGAGERVNPRLGGEWTRSVIRVLSESCPEDSYILSGVV